MILVKFHQPVDELMEVVCKDISPDPMNRNKWLLRFSVDIVWEVRITNIKYIKSC